MLRLISVLLLLTSIQSHAYMGYVSNRFLPFLVSTPYSDNCYQWGITNNGASNVLLSNGTLYAIEPAITGLDCHVRESWSQLGGRTFTGKIAIISTGVVNNHPDLTNILPGVTMSINAIGGVNTTYSQTDQGAGAGEGTAVAGIIAGSGSKTIDDGHICGMVPGAKIIPASVQAAWLTHSNAWFWALTNQARILVFPWGYPSQPDGMRDLMVRSLASNAIVVQAANDCDCIISTTNIASMDWPGSFYPEFQNVIACTVLSYDNTIPTNAAKGSYLVAAPGRRLASTGRPGYANYVYANGTSFSAPHVAGAVALVWAYHPTESSVKICTRIRATLDPLAGCQGKLNIGKAMCSECPVIRPAFVLTINGNVLTIDRDSTAIVQQSLNLKDWEPFVQVFGPTNIQLHLDGNMRFFRLTGSGW